MGGIKFQLSPSMLNIEILISLNLHPVFFVVYNFCFSFIKKIHFCRRGL